MAKQGGIIFFEGTIGGINFYYRKGVPTARIAGGGYTREAIKNSPTMVRVRENNSEFSGSSQTNKFFKHSIRPFMTGYKDGTLHSRLMKLFLKIKDCDRVSKRGERNVFQGMASSEGKGCLKDFVFTPMRPNLFPCRYEFDWDTQTFNVMGFQVGTVGFPAEGTYMEVLLGVVRFDFETQTYTEVIESPLVIERDFSGNGFSISVPAYPSGSGVLFAVARVAFYQDVNGKGYLLPGGNSFGLEVVGVKE